MFAFTASIMPSSVTSSARARAQIATRQPSAASAAAVPRPRPFEAAVTSATLPSIPRSMVADATRGGLGSGPPSTDPRPERAWRVHRRSVVVVLASLALVGACSRTKTLDANAFEETLRAKIEQQLGAQRIAVVCPDDERAQAGAIFQCTATSAERK